MLFNLSFTTDANLFLRAASVMPQNSIGFLYIENPSLDKNAWNKDWGSKLGHPLLKTLFVPTGISVKCTHYAIEVIISRIQQPKLDISTVHLQDPLCKVTSSNDTHALLTSPLESCDTEQRMSKFYFIYSNSLTGDTRFGDTPKITRDGRLKFEFQCLYRRIHVLSIVSYSPRRKDAQTDGKL